MSEQGKIRVVWMDETLQTYTNVAKAESDGRGELVLTLQERHPRGPGVQLRNVHIPLAYVRWWGTPGNEVAW